MPEVPECASAALSINKFMEGKKLVDVAILSGRYTKKMPHGFMKFKNMLPMKSVGWATKGKFIYGGFSKNSDKTE